MERVDFFNKNNYLKEKLFKSLLEFENIGEKPTLFCLITLDNLLDEFARKEYNIQSMNSYNHRYAYENHARWKQYFYTYIDLFDENESIYPNIDSFISSLYINGLYSFLNFGKVYDIHKTFKLDNNNNEIEIDIYNTYNIYKINNTDDSCLSKNSKESTITRMKKGNIIRFFRGEVNNPNCFNDRRTFLTLTVNDDVNKLFEETFKAKNFKFNTMVTKDNCIEFMIDKLIKEMIKAGEDYNEINPIETKRSLFEYERYAQNLNSGSDATISLTEKNKETDIEECIFEDLITEDFKYDFSLFDKYKVGNKIKHDGKFYFIKEIYFMKNRRINFLVEKEK